MDASSTKSASLSRQGRICTCAVRGGERRNGRRKTNRLVFDCGARDAEVEFVVLIDAGIDQRLHRALLLKQQERVTCTQRLNFEKTSWAQDLLTFRRKVRLALSFVWPVHDQRSETTEAGSDLLCEKGVNEVRRKRRQIIPSSMSGGSPPTKTLRENRSPVSEPGARDKRSAPLVLHSLILTCSAVKQRLTVGIDAREKGRLS